MQQQAYMKSDIPYLGLGMPELRRVSKNVFREHPITESAVWRSTVAALWDDTEFREYRYAATELLAFSQYQKKWLNPSLLPQLKNMIVTGAWWDHVDALAINHVGKLLKDYPETIKPKLAQWAQEKNVWVRRTAILAQLKFKADTDTGFLFTAIEHSISDPDFFARKGIGWALREYSKTAPEVVIDYVTKNRDRLSPLSKREGLKVLLKKGSVDSVP